MLEPVKILLLEDVESDAYLIERQFKKGNLEYTFEVVNNKSDFLESLNSRTPHIILSDYYLSDINGLEALSLLRKTNKNIPFIIVTGALDEETVVSCIKAGADDYLTKEKLTRLVSAVSIALEKRNAVIEKEKAQIKTEQIAKELQLLIQKVNSPIIIIDNENKIIEWNTAAENLTGWKKTEVLHTDMVSANKFIIDKVPHLLIITRNISELKKARLEIIQSEEKFRNLFNKTADVVYVHPFSEIGFVNFIEVNDVACKMLGYSKEEFKNLSVKDINVPRDVQKRGNKEARQKFDKNGFSVFETEHLTKEGKKIPVEIRSLIFDLSGEKTIMSIVRDISKIKKTQEELKLSEEKFRKAFYINPDAIAINRLSDGMYIDVNKGFENILNYTKDEVVGKTSAELSIWKYMKDRGRLVNVLKQKGFAENLEAEFLTKNGETKIGSMSANIIKLRKENCIISITRDITERKKTENELQKYREHLEDIVKERTDELETSLEEQKVLNDELYESNKELERFNGLFVGREFRIKELRDKVEELEKKLQKSK